MNKFLIVLNFEYSRYFKSKAFVILTLVLMLLAAGAASIPLILRGAGAVSGMIGGEREGGKADDIKKAAIIDPKGHYSDGILLMYYPRYTWVRLESADGIEDGIKDGTYEMALYIDGLECICYRKGTDMLMAMADPVFDMVRSVYQRSAFAEEGIDGGRVGEIFDAVPKIETVPVGKDNTETFWYAYMLLMALYMTIIVYGQFVVTSVATEKSSKAMELLITSAKPIYLMFGKVIGTGFAGLTQFLLILGTAFAALKLNSNGWIAMSPEIGAALNPSVSSGMIAWAVVFFFLGFFTYSFMFAAAGSTVSSMEEARTAIMVPMLMLVGVFILAMTSLANPGAAYIRVCSFLPFLSPLVMFMRMCVTEVPAAEVCVSVALSLVYIAVLGIACAKVYRVGVMMYGKKLNVKDIVRFLIKA